jgi:glycosyltransferase involved in cell wall biosynthesis
VQKISRRGTGPCGSKKRTLMVPKNAHPDQCVIHIWVPDIDSTKGGIQAFSRFFIRAVADAVPEARIAVFSKNDSAAPEWLTGQGPIAFQCAGWWPGLQRTAAFTSQIVKAALRERPQVIFTTHVNFAKAAHWLRKVMRVHYGAVAHGVDVWSLQDQALVRALSSADKLVAVSNFTRERLAERLGVSKDRIGILPNTFDSEDFVPKPKPHYLLKRFGLQPDQPVILTVARLASADRYKGYDQILRALPTVLRRIPNVRYVLGGRGPDRARIEQLIRQLGVEESVTVAGYVPDHELCDFYNLCDVFAMPSKGEGFGIVFLEALACGKPVIAGNKDGSVDALLKGKLGVLVDPDNGPEIENALILTLTKSHPLTILKEPARLRTEVIEAYGYARFVRTVQGYLHAVR